MRHLHPLPSVDPISGKPLVITEVQSIDGEVVLRSRFDLPPILHLSEEQRLFLETFLRCRGMFNLVASELNVSYPTVNKRLETLLEALGLEAIRSAGRPASEDKLKVLEELEQGQISAEEAKIRLKEAR